jgi:mRNA-degrading endonuclease toxin of MazEF toxin-antitoxin module
LMNNISWFITKMKISNYKETEKVFAKWSLYYVDFWINIWSETNGCRPALIYKSTKYWYWRDTIVIPLTSYDTWKSIDKFDIILKQDEVSCLKNDSILKTRYIKNVSKKRIWKFIWFIETEKLKETIKSKFNIMIWE